MIFAHHEAILPLLPSAMAVGGIVAITGYALLRQVFTPSQPDDTTENKNIDDQQPPS